MAATRSDSARWRSPPGSGCVVARRRRFSPSGSARGRSRARRRRKQRSMVRPRLPLACIPTVTERRHWVALRRSPDLYPDAVTILPGAVVEDVLRSAQDGPGCSVKDSFADLELGRLGFDELFRARWIFRNPVLSSTQRSAIWAVVETADDLAEWARTPPTPRTPFAAAFSATRRCESSPPAGPTVSAPAPSPIGQGQWSG